MTALASLLARIHRGDDAAAEELVRTYGPALRVAVRTRLTDPSLRRHFDSEDVYQSVFASFFARAACGQFEPHDPAGLLRLLERMAVRKVGRRARGLHRLRRDVRRDIPGGHAQLDHVAATELTPDRLACGRELLAAVRAGLPADERRLAELRAGGNSWAEVAEQAGSTADACRKQLRRALDAVLFSLGLEDDP